MTLKAEENAAQGPKRESEPESDVGRLVAARDRDLKDACERNVTGARDTYLATHGLMTVTPAAA